VSRCRMSQIEMSRARILSLGLVVAASAAAAAQPRPAFDLLVRGGTVVDGSGRPGVRADVGVRGGTIAAVALLPDATAREVIDATGLVVAPGFVDVQTHADDIADRPRAENFVRAGVTTIVAGNGGRSALDIGAELARVRQTGVSVNFATLIGHNTVREAVLGRADRPPDAVELEKMKGLVWKAMADGAVGLSTGLQSVPGAYADIVELISLARVAAEAGGLYATHLRDQGAGIDAAVDEAVRVGTAASCPVEIAHLEIDAPDPRGRADEVLARIAAARAAGVSVWADDYGSAAGVLGLDVRERHALTLEDAIRRMTSRPAQHFRFADRGLVDVGYAADLTIFDAARVADRATDTAPHAYPAGIPYVVVNGVVVVRNGEHTGARPGQVLGIGAAAPSRRRP
jgi:N-acyl-D-amino-acid deacylase